MNLELVTRFLFSDRYATDRPTFEKVISANTQLIVVLVFMLGIFFIGRYLIGEKIFGKGKGWKAIIPFYGAYELSRTVSLNPALAVTLFIPVVGIIPFSIFNFILPKAFAKDFKMQLFCLFFPLIAYIVIGVDKSFEYQYQKGKNIAFKNDFKTILPEHLISSEGLLDKETLVSQAAYAAARQAEEVSKQRAELAKIEAEKRAVEETHQNTSKSPIEEYHYDIFSDRNNTGALTSVDIDFDRQFVNGYFHSAQISGVTVPEDKDKNNDQI